MPSPYDLDRQALDELLDGEPAYRARQVWDGLHARLARPEELTELPKALRARLAQALPPALEEARRSVGDGGDTVKWLWRLHDGHHVETVWMRYEDRVTVCASTQAGCAMGCGFCATGQAGFERNLTVGEIVEQVVAAARHGAADGSGRVSNVVLMGMGEPLANYERTWSALERLHHDLGISARHLTVSTVGIVPGIRRLAAEALRPNLAVSLHAANDALRDELVPINRRYPIAELVEACALHVEATGRRLSFEWALIDGVNDRTSDATELADLTRAVRPAAHVNLIPLNPTPGYPTVGTAPTGVRAFRDQLRSLGVNATVRANRGTSIDAACGQLRAATMASDPTPVSAPTRRSS